MTAYFDNLCKAMDLCVATPRTLVLGQAVIAAGTAMHNTLKHLPAARRLELPVAEEMQMGMSIGLSLQDWLPISIYPRINFLLLAVNQLVNHLDKIPLYSSYRPKVIIRTAIATPEPMDPGPQHLGDYTEALALMCSTVRVRQLDRAGDILPAYVEALADSNSWLLVERMSEYATP